MNFRALLTGFLSLLFVINVSSAEEVAGGSESFVYTISDGYSMMVCKSADAGSACANAEIPAEFGPAKMVVPGKFVDAAFASWLSISDDVTGLCSLPSRTSSAICASLPGIDLSGIDVKSRKTESGTQLSFHSRKHDAAQSAKLKAIENGFVNAFAVAKAELQDAVESQPERMTARDSNICIPGSGNPSDLLPGERYCDDDPCAQGGCPVVIIPGTPPAPSNPPLPPIALPGVGGSGGSSGVFYNDGTTGTNLDFTRLTPGCVLEQAFKNQVTAAIAATGSPVGRPLQLDIGDPIYKGGDWVKWETEVINDNLLPGIPRKVQKRIRVHYMYRAKSNEVEQFKFKNSFQYGCEGITIGTA